MIDRAFPNGFLTHSVPELLLMMVSIVFMGFVTLYLLVAAVRILGLLYVTSKEELAWLER
jgi:hypothetical protein